MVKYLLVGCVFLAVVALLLMTGGCAVVQVYPEGGGKPGLSVWFPGVRVTRGAAEAVTVRSTTAGVFTQSGCSFLVVGVEHCDAIRVDARTCGVAIIETPAKDPGDFLRGIADDVRAKCLHDRISTPASSEKGPKP